MTYTSGVHRTRGSGGDVQVGEESDNARGGEQGESEYGGKEKKMGSEGHGEDEVTGVQVDGSLLCGIVLQDDEIGRAHV